MPTLRSLTHLLGGEKPELSLLLQQGELGPGGVSENDAVFMFSQATLSGLKIMDLPDSLPEAPP